MHIAVWVFLFTINVVYINTQSCNYVRKLVVDHRVLDSGTWDSTTITGCISEASFKTKNVENIKIACETISVPKLEKYFMTNINNLKQVLIESCQIQTIQSGAFSNLPKLETLIIEGNPFKNISSGVFNTLPSLQKLYIYYNKVSYIEDHAFANLPNLKYFSIENNMLDHIKTEWFTNTSNIQEFLADRNFIRHIPPDMFHGWKNLSELNLNANDISFIDDGTFRDGAPIMEYLALHHNRLTSISPQVFSSDIFIENLHLSANLLNYLSKEFVENIRVNNIYIFGNPFKCSCLERIYKIFQEREVTVDDPTDTDYVQGCKNSDVPVCGNNPLNNSRICIDSVDKDVTREVISRMKKIGYDSVRTESDYQCAMFDYDGLDPR